MLFTSAPEEIIRTEVANYIAWDPNPETRAAMEKLVADDDIDAMRKALVRMTFGTAGM